MSGDQDEPKVQLPVTEPSVKTNRGDFGKVATCLLAGIFVLQLWNSFGHVPKVTQNSWEYKITSVPDGSFDNEMNMLGKEGWELVFARRASDGMTSSPTFSYEMILKRPI